MRRRWMALLLLVCAAPSPAAPRFYGGAGAGSGAHWAKDARYAAATQLRWFAGSRLEVTAAVGLGAGLSVSYESVLASAPVDLVVYRAYAGPRLDVYAVGWIPVGSHAAGVRLGLTGAFERYVDTATFFVTPGLALEPVFRLRPRALPWLAVDLSLPVVISRRADLVLSVDASVAVGLGFQLPVAEGP